MAFKEGDVRFLICTDVAARGVDIKGLPYVVNMTLPDVPENYIHRIGRVGRQDCLGLAVSIVACDGCKEKVRLLVVLVVLVLLLVVVVVHSAPNNRRDLYPCVRSPQ